MAYWLLKTEAETFGWKDQVSRGKKGEPWTGVRNFQARGNLKEMKKGELAFFYHTGDEKQIVGIAKAATDAYPDPDDKAGKAHVVDVVPVKKLKRPVTLAEIKTSGRFKEFPLTYLPRLSVMPVNDKEWAAILKMAGE